MTEQQQVDTEKMSEEDRERLVWLELVEYWLEHGEAPSHRDLMNRLAANVGGRGWSSESMLHRRISSLREQGKVTWRDGVVRSLRPTQWPDERRPAW